MKCNVPFGDVRFFVGHHERSVMCRFTTLVGNVRFVGLMDF
jgi:hypothetical protein